MLQRLPIALAHIKASNISENLLNEIRQIVYLLHQANKINQKVYKAINEITRSLLNVFKRRQNVNNYYFSLYKNYMFGCTY